MSSSVKSKFEIEHRKMTNLVAIIEKLFHARPRPNVCLKQHIAQLEEAIALLPDHKMANRLVGTFRSKVIRFWQMFEHGDRSPFNGSHRRPTGDEPLPSAEVVRAKLKAAFDQLDKVNSLEEDFEGMKALLLLVTKSRAITMQYWNDVQLLSDIFSFAFEKLPDALQELYQKEYNGKKKWLRDLRLFLQEEIDLHVCVQMEAKLAAREAVKKTKKFSVCFYCKVAGHIAAKCPVLVSTLCVKCFRFGHTDFRCPNEMVFIRLTDI